VGAGRPRGIEQRARPAARVRATSRARFVATRAAVTRAVGSPGGVRSDRQGSRQGSRQGLGQGLWQPLWPPARRRWWSVWPGVLVRGVPAGGESAALGGPVAGGARWVGAPGAGCARRAAGPAGGPDVAPGPGLGGPVLGTRAAVGVSCAGRGSVGPAVLAGRPVCRAGRGGDTPNRAAAVQDSFRARASRRRGPTLRSQEHEQPRATNHTTPRQQTNKITNNKITNNQVNNPTTTRSGAQTCASAMATLGAFPVAWQTAKSVPTRTIPPTPLALRGPADVRGTRSSTEVRHHPRAKGLSTFPGLRSVPCTPLRRSTAFLARTDTIRRTE
jgi:hypothetical protein